MVRLLGPNLQVPAGLTLDDRLLRQMAPQQFGLFVLGSLGAIALLLTVLGTYVLAETMAVMRTRELGIRAALGATSMSLKFSFSAKACCLWDWGLAPGCCSPISEQTSSAHFSSELSLWIQPR